MPLLSPQFRMEHVPEGLDIESESQIEKIPASLPTRGPALPLAVWRLDRL